MARAPYWSGGMLEEGGAGREEGRNCQDENEQDGRWRGKEDSHPNQEGLSIFGGETEIQTYENTTISSIDRNAQPSNTSTLTKTPKRGILFYDFNIFSPSKHTKFSQNLNFWRQTEETESGDSAGPIIQTTHGQEGSGGSLIVFEQYKKNNQNCSCFGMIRMS
jgi:hypothetical protein